MNCRCHICKGTMEGTTGTLDGKWACPACLYERDTGKDAVPAKGAAPRRKETRP